MAIHGSTGWHRRLKWRSTRWNRWSLFFKIIEITVSVVRRDVWEIEIEFVGISASHWSRNRRFAILQASVDVTGLPFGVFQAFCDLFRDFTEYWEYFEKLRCDQEKSRSVSKVENKSVSSRNVVCLTWMRVLRGHRCLPYWRDWGHSSRRVPDPPFRWLWPRCHVWPSSPNELTTDIAYQLDSIRWSDMPFPTSPWSGWGKPLLLEICYRFWCRSERSRIDTSSRWPDPFSRDRTRFA